MTTRYGYFLSSEEHPPQELVRQARLAEEAGFEALWVSDHFHPWLDEQGQSSHVWSVIGAISQVTSLPITTAVTCPLIRQPPAVVAQAAATAALLTGARFTLGVGTGEDLAAAVHLDGVRAYREAGFDEVYVGQVGPDAEGFFDFYSSQVLPRLREG